MKTSRLLAIAFTALASITLSTPALRAHEGHDHGAKNKVAVPDTAAGILQEIQKHHALISAAVTAKNLQGVHDPIEALPPLAKALPDKVADDKKARVQGSVNNLTKAADSLHHAADAGDHAKAETELKKLDGVLLVLNQQLQ
jgi:deferrochelatase/peroxidase EfeB